jgi:hypothetical protein
MSLKHTRCLGWALLGGILGVAMNAWGQDTIVGDATVAALDPTTSLIVEMVRSGGLPGVLALIAWLAARAGPPTIRVIHVQDEASLADRLERLERERKGEA